MQADKGQQRSADQDLWQVSRDVDAPNDDVARLLDLAAFADRTLDEDDEERVAAWLALDPDAAADVAAAQMLAGSVTPDASTEIIARASAAHPSLTGGSAEIIAFPRRWAANWNGIAQWGSVAAAVMVAGWLGFNLGTDAWSGYSQVSQPGDDTLHELLDPSAGTGFMRDLTDAAQT